LINIRNHHPKLIHVLQDSVTGLLLAGVGVSTSEAGVFYRRTDKLLQHITPPPDAQKNFLVVDQKTEDSAIEEAFDRFTQERKDIAILLINQHVCPPRVFRLQQAVADNTYHDRLQNVSAHE